MQELLNRVSFDNAKLNAQVWVCALVLWGIIVACALSSVRSQPFTARQRAFWMFLILAFPIAGLLAYLPFSIRRDELPDNFLFRRRERPRRRGAAVVSAETNHSSSSK